MKFPSDRLFLSDPATQFVTVKGNKLVTAAPLNRELLAPGPELNVAIQCDLKFGAMTQTSTKVFNISVVDRNDNLIKVQDKVTNLTLRSPYFKQVGWMHAHGKPSRAEINEFRPLARE